MAERTPSRARSSRRASSTDVTLTGRRIVWLVGAGLWLLFALSLISFDIADAPSPFHQPLNSPAANWCGAFGAAVAYRTYEMFGISAWVLMILAAIWLYFSAQSRSVGHIPVRALGAIIMAGAVSGLNTLMFVNSGPVTMLGGGLLGDYLAGAEHGLLVTRFATLGSLLWLLAMFAVGAIVALDAWAIVAALWAGRAVATAGRGTGRMAVALAGMIPRGADPVSIRLNDIDDDQPSRAAPRRRKSPAEAPAESLDESLGGIGAVEAFDPDADRKRTARKSTAPEVTSPTDDDAPVDEATDGDDERPEEPEGAEPSEQRTFTPEELRQKIAKLPVRFAAQNRRSATQDDLRDLQNVQDLEGYQFPGLDLLEEPEANYEEALEAYVREQATALERALKEYRINGEVVGIESGPVITNYEIRLAPGTKVAALSAVSSDLARSLKAVNIRIVPNTAGRDTVGIEVPNTKKEKVRLKELMTNSELSAKMRLPMFLGKDASGEPLIEDLAAMPHLLIAGTTGSGKSVCMNAIIMSFLYARKPNELKMVLVDPKMVELSQFKDVPHLMCPVVTEMNKAAAILEWAVGKMEERYELLAEAGCRDIVNYNALTWEELKDAFNPATPEEEARIPRKLPYMVFIIDELADLMMTNREVETSIVRIAQKARAVGIHLIIATQRPQANVVTGLIKSNMPGRICFKVASGMDSRIVMDQKGGELLLGQGDLLYLSPKSHKLARGQGTLVDDKEIRRVVKFLRDIAAPSFERQLVQLRSTSDEEIRDGLANAQDDPLFDQAVEIVLETRRGSVSMLQRRLAIGYTRSARLIEMMGDAGILGTHKGTVAREVEMTLEEWRAIKAQAAADAANGGASGAADAEGPAHESTDLDAPPVLRESPAPRAAADDEFADAFKDEDGGDRYDDSAEDQDEFEQDESPSRGARR